MVEQKQKSSSSQMVPKSFQTACPRGLQELAATAWSSQLLLHCSWPPQSSLVRGGWALELVFTRASGTRCHSQRIQPGKLLPYHYMGYLPYYASLSKDVFS